MKSWTVVTVLALAVAALAVVPASWDHATEADFAPGKFSSTVVSSSGELRLSGEIAVLMPSGKAPAAVSALAVDGKTIYVASGVGRSVYKIEARKAKLLARVPGAMVTALCWTGQELLAGSGGRGAGVYVIDAAGKVTRRWRDPKVRYVWAMRVGPDGRLYVATGPHAAVYTLDAKGVATLLYQAPKPAKNILSLAVARGGLLYAGTDATGLVVEIHPATKASRVILDADEKEVSCLLAGRAGAVYAATSEAAKAAKRQAGVGRVDIYRMILETMVDSEIGGGDEEDGAEDSAPPGDGSDEGDMDPVPAAITTAPSPMEEEGEEEEPTAARPTPTGVDEGAGNAVYHIGTDGLVRPIFRKPVTILAMVRAGERIVLGTGNGGVIYALSDDGQEVAQLARTDAKQVTALATDAEGRIVFATSNKGAVGVLGPGLAREGSYTSKVLDAGQIARWGTATVRVLGAGAVSFATRSGNLAKVDETTWSDWSAEQPTSERTGNVTITSPAGRFLQYRLGLKSTAGTGPAVRQVELIYQVGNLPPIVSAIRVKPSATPREARSEQTGPQAYRLISFSASDGNDDTLTYFVACRQPGASEWTTLAEKLEQPRWVWDTRTVGDGVYELRVTAEDSPANPPGSALSGWRVSQPLIVDNTPPLVTSLAARVEGAKVHVTGTADDAGSRLATIHYTVDSQEDWVAVLPSDGIADSSREDFAFTLEELAAGPHRIAVKVTDLFGNAGYGTLSVTVAVVAAASAPSGQ